MVGFAARRLVASAAAAAVVFVTFGMVAALPWGSGLGATHSCPPTVPAVECRYPAQPAWLLPAAFSIALVGLVAASAVLASPRRAGKA
jgi:hypothetical protein